MVLRRHTNQYVLQIREVATKPSSTFRSHVKTSFLHSDTHQGSITTHLAILLTVDIVYVAGILLEISGSLIFKLHRFGFLGIFNQDNGWQ